MVVRETTGLLRLGARQLLARRRSESHNNNNNFIYTLESEVKLCSVVFTIITGSDAIQLINK